MDNGLKITTFRNMTYQVLTLAKMPKKLSFFNSNYLIAKYKIDPLFRRRCSFTRFRTVVIGNPK